MCCQPHAQNLARSVPQVIYKSSFSSYRTVSVHAMTPARAERERQRAGALQRKLNEEKFTEFRLACGEGDSTACNSLGEWWSTMRGDYTRSMAIFADNCTATGHANSCFNAGLQMSE